MIEIEQDYYSLKDAANILGVDLDKIKHLIVTGKLQLSILWEHMLWVKADFNSIASKRTEEISKHGATIEYSSEQHCRIKVYPRVPPFIQVTRGQNKGRYKIFYDYKGLLSIPHKVISLGGVIDSPGGVCKTTKYQYQEEKCPSGCVAMAEIIDQSSNFRYELNNFDLDDPICFITNDDIHAYLETASDYSESPSLKKVPIKEPQTKDDIYLFMLKGIRNFEVDNNRTPAFSELWDAICCSDTNEYGIEIDKPTKTKGYTLKFDGKEVDKAAISKRYYRYYPNAKRDQ